MHVGQILRSIPFSAIHIFAEILPIPARIAELFNICMEPLECTSAKV